MKTCPSQDTPPPTHFHLLTRRGQVVVRVFGSGPKAMVALHGFGFDAAVFAPWAAYLGDAYTIYAPDLPFHGGTRWSGLHFTPIDMVEIFDGIRQHARAASYTLLGHSLGARIIICTARYWMRYTEQVVLLAPAGIGSYDRVPPRALQHIAEATMHWPHWLGALARWGNRMGIVSNFHRKYTEVVLIPRSKRYQLFRVFNSLPDFSTSASEIVTFWRQAPVSGRIILGSNDKFVPNPRIRAYFRYSHGITIEEITDSHDLVNPRVGQLLGQYLT